MSTNKWYARQRPRSPAADLILVQKQLLQIHQCGTKLWRESCQLKMNEETTVTFRNQHKLQSIVARSTRKEDTRRNTCLVTACVQDSQLRAMAEHRGQLGELIVVNLQFGQELQLSNLCYKIRSTP